MAHGAGWDTERHRTAIGRSGLSMPTRQALGDGIVAEGDKVLDYGSGRGQDVGLLQRMGFSCIGWDPYFNPHEVPRESDVVFLNYVLNVIENGAERSSTLLAAWHLTRKVLVVSTRLHWEARRLSGVPLEDGVLTSRSTFQHLFEPAELRRLVESTTGARVVSPTPGVVYVFRRDEDRLRYLAERTLPRFDWAAVPDGSAALKAVVKFAEEKGRLPTLDEIPDHIVGFIGRLSTSELHRVVMKAVDPTAMTQGARRSTLDTLLYLGVELFTGRGRFSSLPLSIQLDVRKFFGSFKEACRRSDRLLLKLRDDAYIRGAMRNSVGKLTPSALYVHWRAMSSMPVVLRLYEHCGSVAVGRIPDFTLVKLSHDRRAVSWLGYPDFDSDPHPRTAWSFQVTFPELDSSFQDFTQRANRPLLHRKEEFLAPDDSDRPKYERLTRSEVKAGLYANPHLIGTENGWATELQRCGVELRGHRLVRSAL